MIEYISGKIEELTPAAAVIESNGIGYWVNISLNTYSSLSLGKSVKMYIYEAIREDAYILYGFTEKRERELFLLLISVSGVGPNTARMILSSLTPAELEQTIVSENVHLLKAVKGIGAKTAQRIIIDLKDKIKTSVATDNISGIASEESQSDEALAALQMLGFTQAASYKAIQKIVKENPTAKVEDIIKAALKIL
ncbi:MAG: Holliday junction branch migration protein RuvA [Bacteroidaceae bacterium]|nr:Holliday junction branch migration protein RuvA [Bacteroidaceae bacterium]